MIHVEAKRERCSQLALEPDPAPLLRTMLRLRHDLVIVGRAATGAPAAACNHGSGRHSVRPGRGDGGLFPSCANALVERAAYRPAPTSQAGIRPYAAEITALRRELLRVLPGDALERIFALGFALEQMHQHFGIPDGG